MNFNSIRQINFLIILVSFLVIVVSWSTLPDQIPLFYSRPWGEEQLGLKTQIFLLPGISLLVFLVNGFLEKRFLSEKTVFWSQINNFTSLTVTALCFITLVKIVLLI